MTRSPRPSPLTSPIATEAARCAGIGSGTANPKRLPSGHVAVLVAASTLVVVDPPVPDDVVDVPMAGAPPPVPPPPSGFPLTVTKPQPHRPNVTIANARFMRVPSVPLK